MYTELSILIGAGVLAQWVAWAIRLPAILPLLLFGLIAGPFLNLLNPDRLMGDLLFPFVSISVAVILFEGGLSLKLRDIKGLERVIWHLNTTGMLINWLLIGLFAYSFLDLSIALSSLLGAILVVTGPTVIQPLLRNTPLTASLSSVLRWESIVIDPIGAIAAVLALEWVFLTRSDSIISYSAMFILATGAVGITLGLLGGLFIMTMFKWKWVPDYLQSLFTLAVVVSLFVVSNELLLESGLVSVTVMGLFLANQSKVAVAHVLEFKENLTALLISILFIMLAARVPLYVMGTYVNWRSALFVAGVIFVARPVSVAVSTWGSLLRWQERLFLALTAPRGIVAASIGSLFSLKLVNNGIAQAEQLAIYTFLIILITVIASGLFSGYLARLLGVMRPNFYGILIAGANDLSCAIAQVLIAKKIDVLLVDTNHHAILAARSIKIPCAKANILDERVLEYTEARRIGQFLSLTSNDDLNLLAVDYYRSIFGKANVYRLYPLDEAYKRSLDTTTVFNNLNYAQLTAYLTQGYTVKAIPMTTACADKIPLFVLTKAGVLIAVQSGDALPTGDSMIALCPDTIPETLTEQE